MADYINDEDMTTKAVAYAIKAIEALPKQSQDRNLLKRFKSILGMRTLVAAHYAEAKAKKAKKGKRPGGPK